MQLRVGGQGAGGGGAGQVIKVCTGGSEEGEKALTFFD